MSKKVFITGGAGFIGHRLVKKLLEEKNKVTVFDNFHNYMAIRDSNYDKILRLRLNDIKDKIEIIRGDIRNKLHLIERVKENQPSVIIHLAAVPISSIAAKQREEAIEINLKGTINVLEAAKNTPSIKHFIYCSSSMVYGDFTKIPVPEDAPCNPIEIYGTCKLGGEHFTQTYSKLFGFNYTIIRPSAVNGFGAINKSVLQLFCQQALLNKPITVINGDKEKLDFTHVDDVANGFILALKNKNAINKTFNITKGHANSLNEIVKILESKFPNVKVVEKKPLDIKMPKRGALDISKAKKLLGYKPKYNLKNCIESYLEFYKKVIS